MLYNISKIRVVFNEYKGVMCMMFIQIVVYLSDSICPCLHECPVVSGPRSWMTCSSPWWARRGLWWCGPGRTFLAFRTIDNLWASDFWTRNLLFYLGGWGRGTCWWVRSIWVLRSMKVTWIKASAWIVKIVKTNA